MKQTEYVRWSQPPILGISLLSVWQDRTIIIKFTIVKLKVSNYQKHSSPFQNISWEWMTPFVREEAILSPHLVCWGRVLNRPTSLTSEIWLFISESIYHFLFLSQFTSLLSFRHYSLASQNVFSGYDFTSTIWESISKFMAPGKGKCHERIRELWALLMVMLSKAHCKFLLCHYRGFPWRSFKKELKMEKNNLWK